MFMILLMAVEIIILLSNFTPGVLCVASGMMISLCCVS